MLYLMSKGLEWSLLPIVIAQLFGFEEVVYRDFFPLPLQCSLFPSYSHQETAQYNHSLQFDLLRLRALLKGGNERW